MVILKLKDYNRFVTQQMNDESREAIKIFLCQPKKITVFCMLRAPENRAEQTTLYCVISAYSAESKKLVTRKPVVASLPLITQIQVGNTV